ncbi:hypothetical protein A6V29_09870 [Blastococcus sp. CCUG 61487]|nr:hypothetical protein A6V29_09870 [Blastococcus sp. CCUG 61487]
MRRGGARESLGARAANSGAGHPPARPVAPPPALDGIPAGRHCWVHDPPDRPGTWPGLLVEWRQVAGGWQGRVSYAVSGPHGPALVEAWLPASRLEPR